MPLPAGLKPLLSIPIPEKVPPVGVPCKGITVSSKQIVLIGIKLVEGEGTEITFRELEETEVQPCCVFVTVYTPAAVIEIVLLVAPVDQVLPFDAEELNTILDPEHKLMLPEGLMNGAEGTGFLSTDHGSRL